jgi:hypothetical protein
MWEWKIAPNQTSVRFRQQKQRLRSSTAWHAWLDRNRTFPASRTPYSNWYKHTRMISIRRTSSSSSLCYNDHPAENEEEDDEDVDVDAAARKAPQVAPLAFASSLKTLPSQGSTASSCVGSDEIDEQHRREIAESLLALSGPAQQLIGSTMATPPPLDLLPSVPPPPPPPPPLATGNESLQDVSN